MSDFEFHHHPGPPPVLVITPHEWINLTNSAELESAVRIQYETGMRNLVLDLSQTPSITSAGLRAIIVIYRMLATEVQTTTGEQRRLGGEAHTARGRKSSRLKLVQPSEHVRNVLDLAGMTEWFEIYDDLGDAVDSFKIV